MFGRKRSGGKTTEERSTVAHEIVASVQTDKGCVREINEDSGRLVHPSDEAQSKKRGTLLIVADGMGGHSAGEVASGMAVELIPEIYYASKGEPSDALKEAVEEANRRIYAASLEDESKRGMGTTCTALCLLDGQAFAAHVGDSRLYMLRGGKVYQLTEDHSAVMEMVKLGSRRRRRATTTTRTSYCARSEPHPKSRSRRSNPSRCAQATSTSSARTDSTTSSPMRR